MNFKGFFYFWVLEPLLMSGDECAERRFGAVSFSACSTGCGTRFNLAKLSSRCPGWLALLIFSPTMTGKNESASPIKLALELLKRIPRDRYVTAPDLHRQLEAAGIVRSRRTIERQLESLVEEFDIERDDRSKPFGYRWKSHARGLALPMLNEQESLLLALSQRYLQNLLPASVLQSMEGFFYQARSNLLGGTEKLESQWLNKVRVVDVTQPLLPPAVKKNVFEVVSTALYRNQWLDIRYKNASEKVAEYRVMPLGLAQQGPRLYLVCRFEGYDNERSLALHRIEAATASDLTFTPPSDFSLEKYDADGRFGFGEGKKIRLTFCIRKDAGYHLLESPLSTDQTVRELEDGYLIEATVVDSAQLQWWLNGFGQNIWGIEKNHRPPPTRT
ncbi:WYL domain-containing protein [bacterium SGD-2]|nr:WYL domain-containing protein [bacterium SGD-2]